MIEGLRSRPFIPSEQCHDIAQTVRHLHESWVSRRDGMFHTLGASAYNDDPKTYPLLADEENPKLARHFGGLFQYVAQFFEQEFKRPVEFLPHVGLMGFHIFGPQCNGHAGHIHIDEPFNRIGWPCKVVDVFTFTLPVEIPDSAGINFYPTIDAAWFKEYDAGVDIEPPMPEYIPYEVGTMYWHTGLIPHQIANPCDMEQDQRRITLQGHGVMLEDGTIALYF